MAKEDRFRASVRLRIDKGIVLLRYGGVPSVACTLMDLSEGGCRCIAPLNSLDRQTAESWQHILGPERPLNIEVSCPPHLTHFPLDAEVRSLSSVGDEGLDLGLRFRNLDDRQRAALRQAMLSFATDKVRDAFAPGQTAEAGKYLVGAGDVPRPRPEGPAAPSEAPPIEARAPEKAEPQESRKEEAREPEAAPANSPGREAPGEGEPNAAAADSAPAPAVPEVPEPPPSPSDPFRGKRVGEVLVRMGKLTEKDVSRAVEEARTAGERLGRFLLRRGLVMPEELCRALALQSGLPMTDLREIEIPARMSKVFPFETMTRLEMVPIDESEKILCVASTNPIPKAALEELERKSHRKIEVFLAQEDLVLRELDKLRPDESRQERRHMRYKAELPVSFQFCNRLGRIVESAVHEGQTEDISEGGLLVEGSAPNLGAPEDLRRRGLCVNLSLKVSPQEVHLLCALRFVKVLDDTGKKKWPWLFGLQILEIRNSDRRRLKELCIEAGMRTGKGRSSKPFV